VTIRPLATVRAAVLCAVLAPALVLAGCTSGSNDQAATTTPTTTTTTTPTTAPATSEPIRTECQTVADDARALLTEVGRLATRDATVVDVQAAADTLRDSLDQARSTLGPDARAQLDKADQALRQVQDALSASPVDTAALRDGARDLVSALGDAAAICTAGGTATDTSTP
jgi:ElaB/YqjD/DUF883 family membrane-anchored ribosome-binding protein